MDRSFSKSTVSRRAKILEELELKGQVLVRELSKMFNISEVTIRNDLTHLEKQNMLIRARGGAIKIKYHMMGSDSSFSEKQKEFQKEKQLITKEAIKLIEDGDTIVLDSGTTTTEIAKNLEQFKNLTIITNALNIAIILSEYEGFNIFMPGGSLRKKSLSLVGVLADENFEKFYCDKLFLGADGFDTTHGLSTPNSEEAHLNQIMIKIAKKVIVVADSRKFERRRFAFIGPISDIDVVITDSGIKEDDKKRLEKSGVEVIVS
ncbi:MAG: DeoR family transcriptional regulator [Bacteroidetes bacterium GWF2_42_66]|nr:MAG: DeoR family transcriptional regulator [Bacteroidetes bacterium GWA2_42_15]OFY03296.1 MAG: DeoR family transcriptional regulator [Bacteroidetes bacterium GWE2_42_39]OFY45654.1 MAG: DeoR family transcriptional regulator [Bacteroidetes bacterium GWF2_42_66]HBL77364.1 DeoR/GlpR transcriptional regulator [Prolixibacteraceae bacterium]HCU62522.1 DeoR/GlpR transcriptional regulator [Prolixibacteraceae bacterium]